MKIICEQQKLAEAIVFAARIISPTTTSTVAQNLKFIAKGNSLEIRSTNLEQSVIYYVSDIDVQQEGEICIQAKMLERLFKGFRRGIVEIEGDSEMIIHIKHGGQNLKLYGYDPEEFPIFPEFDEEKAFLIPGKQIAEQINHSVFAVSREKTRFAIDGVLFEINDKLLTLVGTDGKRLAITMDKVDTELNLPDNIIVPPKWLSLLSDLIAKGFEEFVKIQVVDNRIMAMMGPVIMSSQLVAGVFPNYKAVMPEEFSRKLTVNREDFLYNIRQAEQFVSEDSLGVKFDIFKDKLLIKSRSAEKGEALIEVSAAFDGSLEIENDEDDEDANKTESPESFVIGFNPQYITDILKIVHDDEFVMEINDPEEPVRVKANENFIYIVMPAEI